jgi:nickel superoxide dismutase
MPAIVPSGDLGAGVGSVIEAVKPSVQEVFSMRFIRPTITAYAHCDLPCGVYDPAQARIEAESVKAIQEKYQGNDDPVFRTRALLIKEQRADLVKHHLWVLWTDYFKPPHFEKYPNLHDLFNRATKQAGAAGGKQSVDPAEGQKLLDLIAEIDTIFWETKKAA